jgi:hypothetical protein
LAILWLLYSTNLDDQITKLLPILQHYEHAWPIDAFLKQSLASCATKYVKDMRRLAELEVLPSFERPSTSSAKRVDKDSEDYIEFSFGDSDDQNGGDGLEEEEVVGQILPLLEVQQGPDVKTRVRTFGSKNIHFLTLVMQNKNKETLDHLKFVDSNLQCWKKANASVPLESEKVAAPMKKNKLKREYPKKATKPVCFHLLYMTFIYSSSHRKGLKSLLLRCMV